MSEYQFHKTGTIPKPGWIGRLVRLFSSALMLYLVIVVTNSFQYFVSGEVDNAMLWLLVLLAFHLLPAVVNIGFGVNYKSKPQWWFVIVFLLSVYFGYFVEGDEWGTVSVFLLLALQLYVFIHLAISFLLAALIATPGCEMRSIPHLLSLLKGQDAKEHFCPGYIDTVDRWESRRFNKS